MSWSKTGKNIFLLTVKWLECLLLKSIIWFEGELKETEGDETTIAPDARSDHNAVRREVMMWFINFIENRLKTDELSMILSEMLEE